MQESQHEREGIDNNNFRVLTGLVGLVALLYVAVDRLTLLNQIPVPSITLMGWVWIVAPTAGWGGLVYACWIRSGRFTKTALAFVLVLGVLGGVFSLFALDGPVDIHFNAIVSFTGTWIMNGLGIVWIVHKVRRIRAASNIDAADASR